MIPEAPGASSLATIRFFLNRHRGLFGALGGLGVLVGFLEGVNLGAFFPILYAMVGVDASAQTGGAQGRVIELVREAVRVVPVADPFLAACALFAFVTLLKSALSLVHEYLSALFAGRLMHEYRHEIIARLAARPLPYFEESRVGALIYDLTQPPVMLSRLLYQLPRLLVDFLRALFVGAVLFYVEPTIATLLGALAAVVFFLGARRMSEHVYQLAVRRRDAERSMSSTATEWLHGVRPIRIAGADDHWLGAFDRSSGEARTVYVWTSFLLASPRHVFELLGLLLLVAGLMLAYHLDPAGFGRHVVTIGIFAMGLVRILPSVAALARGPLEIRTTIPDVQRIQQLLASDDASHGKGRTQFGGLRNAIRLQDVQVVHPNGVRALDGVNLEIPRGSVVALVGPSGCGKTTLLNTVIGVQRVASGHVYMDDLEVGSLEPRSLLDRVGYVGQRVLLFHGSIRQNIAFFRENPSPERIAAVARLAKIDEFVASLRGGYDALVGEGGANLSGGQAQRLALARALYNEPDMLVLDEPTSALDSSSENYVLEAIQSVARERTVILVTHRLSSAKWAHRICVMDRGKVVAEGSWDELLADNETFRQMCREQGML
ncbi:MAG TPA: ABC transporter ATP-binding protein [Burkholderiales bacterium]|nr:ABC transporter ATP-binding protein [Burkholderiales bacterium]